VPRERYIIVGLAKTGTTAVAMTLRNTLRVSDFCMEPNDSATIEQFEVCERVVIKIIFDHWRTRVDALHAVLRGGPGSCTPTVIAIVRDPRDEAVSRLHYMAYDYFSTRATTPDDRAEWIEIFRNKEATPDSISLLEMEQQLKTRFGRGCLPGKDLYQAYRQFIDEITNAGGAGVHLLRYEDFVRGTISDEALRAMLSASRDVGPWLRRVHRSGSSGGWQHFLTDRDLAFFNGILEPFLRRFDYPLERTIAPERPPRATGSDYVEKLIDEAGNWFNQREVAGKKA
jgi:Sulfotransferase domain